MESYDETRRIRQEQDKEFERMLQDDLAKVGYRQILTRLKQFYSRRMLMK